MKVPKFNSTNLILYEVLTIAMFILQLLHSLAAEVWTLRRPLLISIFRDLPRCLILLFQSLAVSRPLMYWNSFGVYHLPYRWKLRSYYHLNIVNGRNKCFSNKILVRCYIFIRPSIQQKHSPLSLMVHI